MRVYAWILASIPVLGCYHYGQHGNLGLNLDLVDPLYEFQSGDRLIMGSRICPTLGFAKFDGDGDLVDDTNAHCFWDTLTGSVDIQPDGCWILGMEGQIVWEWMPTQLAGCEPKYLGDRMIFNVTGVSPAVKLGFDDWRARAAQQIGSVEGLSPGKTIDDLAVDPDAERRIFSDQIDVPLLQLADPNGRLYFSDVDLDLAIGPGADAVYIPDDSWRNPGEVPLRLTPGTSVRIRATLPGGAQVDSPPMTAVSPNDAAALDLVVVKDDDGVPIYAHAQVHDVQNRILHAAPIEWSVIDGALGVYPGALNNEARSADYALLVTQCEPPAASPIQRHATLKASLGQLEDAVELTWTEMTAVEATPDPACMFGPSKQGSNSPCTCSANYNHPAPGGIFFLATILYARRRNLRLFIAKTQQSSIQ